MYKLTLWVLSALALGTLLLMIWAIDKGFDITDEAFFLMLLQNPTGYVEEVTSFHLIVGKLIGHLEPNIFTYRWLRLVLSMLSALGFAWGFYRWLGRYADRGSRRCAGITLVGVLFLVGGLATFGGLQTLSYNDLNVHCVLLVAGLLFYLLSRPPVRMAWSGVCIAAFILIGAVTAIDFFIKFPTAILLLAIPIGSMTIHHRGRPWREAALAIGWVLVGAAVGASLFFGFVQPAPAWFEKISVGLRIQSTEGHNLQTILELYVRHTGRSVAWFLIFFSPVFAVCAVVTRLAVVGWHRRSLRNQCLLAAITALAALYALHSLYILKVYHTPLYNNARTVYLYFLILGIQCTVLLVLYWTKRRTRVNSEKPLVGKLLGVTILFVLPFVSAWGTNVHLLYRALGNPVPWFALVLLLSLEMTKQLGRWRVGSLCILAVAAFGISQTVYGTVWVPYNLADKLYRQTAVLERPPMVRGLNVDPPTKQFFDEVQSLLRRGDYAEGDRILGLYNLPGLVHLMGGVSPGQPTYWAHEPARNCHALRESDPAATRTFVIVNREIKEIEPEFLTCMHEAGVLFPERYVELGTVYDPYIEGAFCGHKQWVKVFAPITVE